MAEHDNLPYIVIERRSGYVTPFLWGLLIGAGVALLYAPRAGRETQDEIRDRVRRIRDTAEDRFQETRERVNDTVFRTRDRLQNGVENVRSTLATRSEQAREAMEAGRRAARDARDELEERVSRAKREYAENAREESVAEPTSSADLDVAVVRVEMEDAEQRPRSG